MWGYNIIRRDSFDGGEYGDQDAPDGHHRQRNVDANVESSLYGRGDEMDADTEDVDVETGNGI